MHRPLHAISHVHPRFLPPSRIHSRADSPASLTPRATSPTLVSSHSPCHPPVKQAWDTTDVPQPHLTRRLSQEARPRSNEKKQPPAPPIPIARAHEHALTPAPPSHCLTHPPSPLAHLARPPSCCLTHPLSHECASTRSPRRPLRAVSPIHPHLSPTSHNHPHTVSPTGIPCRMRSPRRLPHAVSPIHPHALLPTPWRPLRAVSLVHPRPFRMSTRARGHPSASFVLSRSPHCQWHDTPTHAL